MEIRQTLFVLKIREIKSCLKQECVASACSKWPGEHLWMASSLEDSTSPLRACVRTFGPTFFGSMFGQRALDPAFASEHWANLPIRDHLMEDQHEDNRYHDEDYQYCVVHSPSSLLLFSETSRWIDRMHPAVAL
jgi:hypothetical protein